jgi:hypothetical protein
MVVFNDFSVIRGRCCFFKNVVEFMLVSKYDPMNLNQVDTTNLISIYEIYQ